MKKILFAATAALLMMSCQQPASNVSTEQGIRLAYVRIDSMQSQYLYFQELVTELQAEEEEIVTELQRRQHSLQENIALYQQEAPKMTPRQREANEADLMRVQQQYMAIEQGAQQKLAQKQSDLTVQLRKDMDKAIEVLKNELNLDFILLYEEGGQIIYANNNYDITEQMVTLLNENREVPAEDVEETVSDTSAAE
jgi:outer membrane protein